MPVRDGVQRLYAWLCAHRTGEAERPTVHRTSAETGIETNSASGDGREGGPRAAVQERIELTTRNLEGVHGKHR